MIDAMETEDVALVFSRHIAQPKHSAFVHRDINDHFANLSNYHRKKVDRRSKVPSEVKNFNSDNCALYRKEVLRQIPFRDVLYGEDQLWAKDILAEKFSKYYLNSAYIIHSHDEGDSGIVERAEIETRYFVDNFQISFNDDWTDLVYLNRLDVEFAEENDLDEADIQKRIAFNTKVVEGRRAALENGGRLN